MGASAIVRTVLVIMLGTAEMITTAEPSGYSSVMLKSIWAVMPAGVIFCSRANAPPVRARVGLPLLLIDHAHVTPEDAARRPVPSALAQASLAANRLA